MYQKLFMKRFFSFFNLDLIGLFSAILCAIHCAIISLLFILSTLGGLYFFKNHIWERVIITLSILIALISLLPGYFKYHRRIGPLLNAVIGFGCIGIAHIFPVKSMELLCMPLGSLFIALAHLKNRHLMRQRK